MYMYMYMYMARAYVLRNLSTFPCGSMGQEMSISRHMQIHSSYQGQYVAEEVKEQKTGSSSLPPGLPLKNGSVDF